MGMSKLRAGRRVKAALGVRYLVDDGDSASPVEAIDFLLDAGPSVLLSCDTDWTLKISEGRWPTLPAWCWPVEAWGYEQIDEIGSSGLDEIVAVSDVFNSVGELCGILLEFPSASMVVSSGEAVTWEISRKGPGQ